MRYLTYLPLLAVLVGLDPLMHDDERDSFRFRSSRSSRHWQPSVTYPPYAQPSLNVSSLDVPSLAGPSYAQPGIGYPSYAPQPNHVEAADLRVVLEISGPPGESPRNRSLGGFHLQSGNVGRSANRDHGFAGMFPCCQSNPSIYVQFLFVQLTGREPSQQELHYWVSLLHHEFQGERRDFCRALVNNIV